MSNTMEEIRKITSDWHVQTSMASCLPTCLTNILMDAEKHRFNQDAIGYSHGQVCGIVGYSKMRGTPWYEARDGLRRRFGLDKYKQWYLEDAGGKQLKIKDVCDIVASDRCSYPLISIGPEYLRDVYDEKLDGYPHTWLDHCVVVLYCTGTNCIIHDPYATIKDKEPLLELSLDKLIKYWLSAETYNKMMWLRMMRWPLEEFGGKEQNDD